MSPNPVQAFRDHATLSIYRPLVCRVLVGVCVCVFLGSVVAQVDPGDAPYSPGKLLDVRIQMDPEDWKVLRVGHRTMGHRMAESPFAYYKATVVIDGTRFESVGVRKKGFFGSVVSTKPSLKIRFDRWVKKQDFHGLDQLTLNNNVQDASHLHQYLAYSLFRKAGVPAPRCNLAMVTLNGERLGIYTNVESIRKPFLRRVFGNSKGILYEGYAADFDDTATAFGKIVNKDGRPESKRKPLARLREVLKHSPLKLPEVRELVDLPSFLTFWASEVLVGHWDSYSSNRNNYYVYRDKKSKRFFFIPWGADSVFWDPGPFILQPVPRSVKAIGVLCRRLWTLPEVRKLYQAEMRRLLAEVWNEKEILAEIDRMKRLLRGHVDEASFEARLQETRAFITTRRASVEPELGLEGLDWPVIKKVIGSGRPAHLMKLTGSFSTKIVARDPEGLTGVGQASLDVSIDGEKQPGFESVVVIAKPEQERFIRPGYPVIRIVARDPATERLWNLRFIIDPIRAANEKPDLPIDHFCVWVTLVEGADTSSTARRTYFGIGGRLTMEKFDAKLGGAMAGSFEIQVPLFGK